MPHTSTNAGRAGDFLPLYRNKESPLKLSLETCRSGAVIVVHCEGRIVYREEAAALSRVVTEALQHAREVILDLAAVQRIDSAGLGELVLLHMAAEGSGCSLKLARPSPHVRELLDLTNLSSIFEISPTLEDAIEVADELPSLS